MLWNVLQKAFTFYMNNWSTKNCSQTQNFPFRYFKMFHFKIHDQKILMLPNSLFSLPPSELIFFPSWATAALHPFSPVSYCVRFPRLKILFSWHVITMQLLCPVGRLYFAVQKQLHSPVYKTPKLEIHWGPPAAQRDTAYPKTKTLSLFWKWCIFSAWIKLGF